MIHANVRTEDGFRIAHPPYQRISLESQVVAEAIAVALAVREPVATPNRTEYPRLATEYYSSTGAKNHRQFMKDARYFEISASEEGFVLLPKINGGVTGSARGFSPDDSKIERFPANTRLHELAIRIIDLIQK